jgi:hypothetical protein
MNLSLYFLISVLLSKARSALYINDDGVTFEYSLNFQNKCRSHIGRFVFFHGLSIAQCAEECALRPKCAALNYRRRATVCELFSTAEEGDTHIGDCIFMRTTDINVQQVGLVNTYFFDKIIIKTKFLLIQRYFETSPTRNIHPSINAPRGARTFDLPIRRRTP